MITIYYFQPLENSTGSYSSIYYFQPLENSTGSYSSIYYFQPLENAYIKKRPMYYIERLLLFLIPPYTIFQWNHPSRIVSALDILAGMIPVYNHE
jgi:hypothetical protein